MRDHPISQSLQRYVLEMTETNIPMQTLKYGRHIKKQSSMHEEASKLKTLEFGRCQSNSFISVLGIIYIKIRVLQR